MKLVLPKKSKHALIIFLLWAFAPAAWFLLWRDKKYHSWFPKLLWVNGIIFSVIFVTQSFVFIPKLEEIYTALKIEVPSSTTPLAALVILAFVLLQIPAGMHLQKKITKQKSLTDKYVLPILFIFLVDGFIALSTGVIAAVQSPTALVERYLHEPKVQIETPINKSPIQTLQPTQSPSPTVKPLSFAEINAKFGPCVSFPVLMYHHIEDMNISKKNNRSGINVDPSMFLQQMEYLNKKGYKTTFLNDLISFFDNGTSISAKTIAITFDDAYSDFYFNAYPILKSQNIKSTMYVPTGLIGNPGYLTWDQISEMQNSGLVNFGNHTWSHKQLNSAKNEDIDREITTADIQLINHNVNNPKTFAYPYGPAGIHAEATLATNNYKLAFTTTPGKIMCKKQALYLPRTRIGNAPLLNFGF